MIYLIYKIDFDNSENSESDAAKEVCVGYSDAPMELDNIKQELRNNECKYKGWDGLEYPIFYSVKVDKINK